MARPVKIRPSYDNDAQFLLRLKKAVEADENRPPEWRKAISQKLHELTQDLLAAPPPSHFSENLK